MTRRTKQQQLEAHLQAIQRLRKEIAGEQQRAKRRQAEALAKGVAELGLVETVLGLSKEEREQIGRLESPAKRCAALVKTCEEKGDVFENTSVSSARVSADEVSVS